MNALFWSRTDLRTRDNPALAAAMAEGPALALFYLAPTQWREHEDSPGKVDFWLRNLANLSDTLDGMNVPLKFIDAQDWHDAAERMATFCAQHKVTSVHVNAEWGVNEQRRDEAVAQRLGADGIAFTVHQGATLLIPGTVLTGKGECYKVFTPFARACRERLHTAHVKPSRRPSAQPKAPAKRDPVPTRVSHYDPPDEKVIDLWPAGEDAASDRLSHFVDRAIDDYAVDRDIPSLDGTSQISAYLAAGVISPVQCLHAAMQANQGEIDSGKLGAKTWITELLWRDFYQHLLAANPTLSMHRPMQPHTEKLPWRSSQTDLDAWQSGQTGIPIVDAAMRQMLALGWMHNRLRMVSAMFMSKNLLLDWRLGESWFMRHLVDGDLASNNGGWQWSASTGADAVPYFRVFNPVTQSQRFDPEGTFIRQWVPELKSLDKKQIHFPGDDARKRLGYPEAIVDLSSSRKRAIEAFAGISRVKS